MKRFCKICGGKSKTVFNKYGDKCCASCGDIVKTRVSKKQIEMKNKTDELLKLLGWDELCSAS